MSGALKKILYVSCGNGLSDNLGGSLVRTIEIARRLSHRGVEIHFLTTSGGYEAANRKGMKAVYYTLPASLMDKQNETWIGDRALAYTISSIASFKKIEDLPDVDLIYTDSDYFCDVIPAVFYKKKHSKAKWCAMVHHLIGVNKSNLRSYLISALSQILQKECWRTIGKYADGVMVYDTDMGYLIKGYFIKNIGFDETKIYPVTNGIDLGAIDKIPNIEKKYEAVMVGGLRPNKGLYDIVPIWAKVVSKSNNAKLAIVGGSTYMNWLEREVEKANLRENIYLLGNKSHNEAIAIIKSAKIYITPSREEGWGIAVCEALACKLPVVAYDLSVYKKTFGDSIITVSVGDHAKFALKILDLLTKQEFSFLKGHKIASMYDWDSVASKEYDILAKA